MGSLPEDGGKWNSERAHPAARVQEQGSLLSFDGIGFRTCLCDRVMRDGCYSVQIDVVGQGAESCNFLVGVAMPDVNVGGISQDRVEFCGKKGWGFYNGERGGMGDEAQAFYHADKPMRDDGGQIVRCDYVRSGETLGMVLQYEDKEPAAEGTDTAGELPGTLSFFRQHMPLRPIVFRRCIPRGVCFAVTAYRPDVRLRLQASVGRR
eukprot:g2716.t1